jgi:Transposase DDE domain
MADALGNAVGFLLTRGQDHDLAGADEFLPQMEADILLADKAFDADERVIEPLAKAGKIAVIPPKSNRKTLQSTPSHREFLRKTQAIPCHRHPLRQNRHQFPRCHPSRRRCNLAQLRTGPNDLRLSFDNCRRVHECSSDWRN